MEPGTEIRYLLVKDPDAPNQYLVFKQLPFPIRPGQEGVPEDSFLSLSGEPAVRGARIDPAQAPDLIKLAASGSLGQDDG